MSVVTDAKKNFQLYSLPFRPYAFSHIRSFMEHDAFLLQQSFLFEVSHDIRR